VADKQDVANSNKPHMSFNIENELEKLKISIPLMKLMNKIAYRSQVMKSLSIGENIDTFKISDDQLEILFGPEFDEKLQEGDVSPFYVSLMIHDKILHNAMPDLGASQNVMPKVIMEKLTRISLNLELNSGYGISK